ncbi:MAG: bifunctional diaminohydroxyphosphoribosylaminopyrimidine deaminase/5-amino-6-(5-phosphoribosylamino)uracil reductase RibD [Polaribacter sp.]|nr:bifunctional diaminohydroxyphosphoribosylaminopyrimidine deaminase/5-amino-6-(5-phosphoribosylamino)uracil reductase RibD [Polaribacter sp.]
MKHKKYIQRCLELAKKGIGTTRPNPSVGAVIVLNDKIIGEGYTSPYGGNHAEVNAINSVEEVSLLHAATLYVTLEPCAHFGKTPPCADLIVKHQLKHVVIGCVDSNSLVAGKGIERLRKGGCEVTVGVLEKECLEHHRRFFTVQDKKRPYILLKWAETKDGYIAPLYPKLDLESDDNEMLNQVQYKEPVWISNLYSQQLVHKWRSEEQAILVGTNTIIADNPKLNVRSWKGHDPVRVVLDKKLRIPVNANVFDGTVKTLILTEQKKKTQIIGLVFEVIDFSKNVAEQICEVLQKQNIQSVLVEGGTQTLQTFIDANLWDEARVFIGSSEFGEGVGAPCFSGKLISENNYHGDLLKTYRND